MSIVCAGTILKNQLMRNLINRLPGSLLMLSSKLHGLASRLHVESLDNPRDSANVLEALPGKLDIKDIHQVFSLCFQVEQLSHQTGEESVLLTASISDGTLSHLGSESGKIFLDRFDDFKSQFLGFCIKSKSFSTESVSDFS